MLAEQLKTQINMKQAVATIVKMQSHIMIIGRVHCIYMFPLDRKLIVNNL